MGASRLPHAAAIHHATARSEHQRTVADLHGQVGAEGAERGRQIRAQFVEVRVPAGAAVSGKGSSSSELVYPQVDEVVQRALRVQVEVRDLREDAQRILGLRHEEALQLTLNIDKA